MHMNSYTRQETEWTILDCEPFKWMLYVSFNFESLAFIMCMAHHKLFTGWRKKILTVSFWYEMYKSQSKDSSKKRRLYLILHSDGKKTIWKLGMGCDLGSIMNMEFGVG